jgi:hypothetical protein
MKYHGDPPVAGGMLQPFMLHLDAVRRLIAASQQ